MLVPAVGVYITEGAIALHISIVPAPITKVAKIPANGRPLLVDVMAGTVAHDNNTNRS